jgi:hypothetical protein
LLLAWLPRLAPKIDDVRQGRWSDITDVNYTVMSRYRSFLDAQTAAKRAAGTQPHCDQVAQQEQVRQQHRQMVQAALGAAHDANAYK